MARLTQRERRDRTETALVAAAAELVVESGLRSMTLARVGERAGYSRGIVNHHFGTKQALLEALAHATQSGFVPGVDRFEPGLDRLLAVVEGYVGALGDISVISRAFLLLWAESSTTPELTDLFRARDEGFRSRLRADVEAGIAEGRVRPDVASDDVAVTILGQLRGIGLQRVLAPDVVDTERLRHVVADQWRRALSR
ncbi:TetR/AcrR family transcriptional regulator [Umezawaea tangerina]|uniref:TetR family transcriptional regulator n=1 Tax=Umezawaea tangerina TaxID=84725 RepID=A0A2T0SXU1_9PSEU|nr:TetR/AcrR family transcriptional regulator [Umezawaea tangerina]PRY38209.1 TetR family transcriptional regulator [Umezawaea tangerina]